MSGQYRISNFVPIQLHHDYSNIVHTEDQACLACTAAEDALSVTDLCGDLVFAMIEAFVSVGKILSQAQIFARVRALCGDVSDADLQSAFRRSTRQGIIQMIVPSVVNYLVAPPETTYTLSARLDEKATHRQYVLFLLQQIGGLQSPNFVEWFLPYRFQATKFDIMGNCTVNTFG